MLHVKKEMNHSLQLMFSDISKSDIITVAVDCQLRLEHVFEDTKCFSHTYIRHQDYHIVVV